ncbi:unnamed protein product [Rodentolepis nana]|uniref:C2H2-type domain-containing protein n=1 Tax=Rodentolepis nana TaxID=102285 RepID=A0A158QIN1_RODNA|nr:unnamed protein product [Rodentolepis nana]
MSKSNGKSRKSLVSLKGAGPLGCGICHMQFPTPDERIQHARDKHNVHKSKFPCTACNITGFSVLNNLKHHIRAKCLGVGWEERFINKSDADLASSELNDGNEKQLKCNQSKSLSLDSNKALEQNRRPSLRSSKPEKPENCGASTQGDSAAFSGSLPSRKRRMSDAAEKPLKIPSKKLKSDENVPKNKGEQLESTQNDKIVMRRTRHNSSIDTKQFVSKLTKSRKTSSLSHENLVRDTTDKNSIEDLNTEPGDEHTRAKAGPSNLAHISKKPESKSFDRTLPLRKRRISSKIPNKKLKSGETDDMASKEEPEHAIKSVPAESMSTVPGKNLENYSFPDTGAMEKTKANSSNKVESGFSRSTSQKLQNYGKSPPDVQESGKESILDSISTSHEAASSLGDIFSSRSRRVVTKIPKKNSKSIESQFIDCEERNRKQEQESESKLMSSESISKDKSGNDDKQDQPCASERLSPMTQTRSGSSSVVSSGVSKATKERLKKSRIISVEPSDQKGILPSNDLSEIDNDAKSSNRMLSTSKGKFAVDVKKSPSHFHSTISNSIKRAKKGGPWKIRSEKEDPSNIPVKKSHSPHVHKSLVRAASLKTKKLPEYFKDSVQKDCKKRYSMDSAGASCESLSNDNTIPTNAIGVSHLESIAEEKAVSPSSTKESKSKSVSKESLELLKQADSNIMVSCGEMRDSSKSSKECQQSEAEAISKVTGENIEIHIASKDMESASALASTSDFRKRLNSTMSGKRAKGIVKGHQNSSSTSPKAKEPAALESADTSLDAKRLELKRLRESLGLDFSHTPRSTSSSVSSNASGSSALGSPQTPKTTFDGLNLLKSSQSTPNPSTQLTVITPKVAEKFALLDWDSFIAKASSKSRTPTVQTETSKKLKTLVDMKIKKIVSPKTPTVSTVEEKSVTGPLSEETGNSLENTEKAAVSNTPESPSKPSKETKSRLHDCDAELSTGNNFSAASGSPLISEKPSPKSKANTPKNSKSGVKEKDTKSSTKVSAEDISLNSEMSTGSKIPELAEETQMEVETDSAVQDKQITVSPLDYKASLLLKSFQSLLIFFIVLQEIDDSHDVVKNDDESSESTVPCYGESSIASDSDRESGQNAKMSMLSCPVCHVGGFATKAELKVHLTISCREEEPQKKKVIKKRKRPIEWYCPGCPRSFGPFESAKALLDHLPTCHIKRAAFLNGESKTGKGKGRHFQLDPKDLPFWPAPLPTTPVTYGCPVCGCFFATASRLDQHRSEADHFHVVGRFLNTNGHFKYSK